jgi:hypothetical protein
VDDEKQMIELGYLELLKPRKPHIRFPTVSSPFDVLECSPNRTAMWSELMAKNASTQEKDFKALVAKNMKVLYQKYSVEALQLIAEAFQSVEIPLILGPSMALGWYQQCNVPLHFSSMDLLIPFDAVQGKEHFNLLQVWSFLLFLPDSPHTESSECQRGDRAHGSFSRRSCIWADSCLWLQARSGRPKAQY